MSKRYDDQSLNEIELYRQTIEKMPLHIYWKDKDFRYVSCNLLHAKNAGFASPKEIINKTDYEIFPKEQADQLRQNDMQVINNKRAFVFEEPWINGSDERIVYLSQKMPLFNNKGDIVGLAGISIDITERKTYEENLLNKKRNVERTLASIIDNLPGHVYWKDANFVFQGCNLAQAKSAGFESPEDLIGKTDYEMPWREEADILRKSDHEVFNSRTTITREEISKIASSKQVAIYLSKKTPLYNEVGAVVGVLGISFDITERKKLDQDLLEAKEKAETASRAKTEFIANMGHDIRTPLTGIIGFSRYLEEEIQNQERKACAKQIYESGEQLLGLLNGVLDLVTAESTHENSVLQMSFDVRQVIHDVFQLEVPAVKTRHLEIRENVDARLPCYLEGDRMKLHRILLNLIGNAIKFTELGYIEISVQLVEMQGDIAVVSFAVKDTGIGIPDELQGQVFDRFFKVIPSYKGLYTGNGIGLHIAQKYVRLLGGQLELESQVGVGTKFFFTIPMKKGEAPTDENLEHSPLMIAESPTVSEFRLSQVESQRALKVLLVEDNKPAMTVLKMMVQKFDVSISAASDAESAFELIAKQPFDLLITDLGLPGKQGDELSTMIRIFEQQQARKPMTIIGLTGHALGEISKACIDAGMNELYRKPMTQDALKKLLTPLINEHKPQETPEVKKGLGPDLPETEAELFEINQHALFDLNVAKSFLGNEVVVRDIFKTFKQDGIADDLVALKAAHAQGDWTAVQKLAHKMKGGAVYGTVRLHYALLYMERYLKAGHTQSVEQLYAQMLRVIAETLNNIDAWIATT
jgi:two-component system aerobic respiration control sensor histidine kinase ArcB